MIGAVALRKFLQSFVLLSLLVNNLVELVVLLGHLAQTVLRFDQPSLQLLVILRPPTLTRAAVVGALGYGMTFLLFGFGSCCFSRFRQRL